MAGLTVRVFFTSPIRKIGYTLATFEISKRKEEKKEEVLLTFFITFSAFSLSKIISVFRIIARLSKESETYHVISFSKIDQLK